MVISQGRPIPTTPTTPSRSLPAQFPDTPSKDIKLDSEPKGAEFDVRYYVYV